MFLKVTKKEDSAISPSCGDINTIQRSLSVLLITSNNLEIVHKVVSAINSIPSYNKHLIPIKTTVREFHVSGLPKLLNTVCFFTIRMHGLYIDTLSTVHQLEQTDRWQVDWQPWALLVESHSQGRVASSLGKWSGLKQNDKAR